MPRQGVLGRCLPNLSRQVGTLAEWVSLACEMTNSLDKNLYVIIYKYHQLKKSQKRGQVGRVEVRSICGALDKQ